MIETTRSEPSQGLRDAHLAHTRQRLLDGAIDLLVSENVDELSLREVAKQAGVSAPTAYRHFPTKEALFDALVLHIEEHMSVADRIDDVEGFIATLPKIHQSFQQHARLMTAYVRVRAARDLRDAGRKRRARRVATAVKASFPRLDGEALDAFSALMQLYSFSGAWELWRTQWGLEGAKAGRVAAWAARALADALKRDPKSFHAALAEAK